MTKRSAIDTNGLILQDLVAGVGMEDDPIEATVRLGARLILQQAKIGRADPLAVL